MDPDDDATIAAPVEAFLGAPSEPANALADTIGPRPALPGRTSPEALEHAHLRPGDSLGRYTVLARLGAGGMGVVYGAYDPQLDRKIAVKLIRGASDDESQGRLLREAQALARISHPNVVGVYDVGTVHDHVYVAMEYVRGLTLRTWLHEKKGTREQALVLLRQAGEGLAAAHACGLVHRDFKPENVLVDGEGRARVLDFGLARETGESIEAEIDATLDELRSSRLSQELTRTGMVMGTPAYMAPEQLLGHSVDSRADQFSFCVVAFEAMYGKRPFHGETMATLASKVLRGKVAKVDRTGVSPAVQRAIDRGLRIVPDERWPDMHALLRALEPSTPKRSGAAIAFGVATGTAMLVAMAVAFRGSASDPCADSATEIDAVWNDERRERVHEAFAATGLGFAETTWTRTNQVFDGYATAWSEGKRDNCEATRVAATQSERMHDLRAACLAKGLAHFDTLVGVFEELTADELERVVQAVDGLPSLESCADTERLANSVEAPPPDRVEGVAEVRRELGSLAALHATGRFAEAIDRSEVALARAREVDYPPVVAEAQSALADALANVSRWDDAVATLRAGIITAEASAHDQVRLEMLGLLGRILGSEKFAFDEALQLAGLTRAVGERIGWNQAEQGRWEDAMGALRFRKGERREAIPHFRRALELREASLAPDDSRIATTLTSLTTALQADAQYEEALAVGRRAVDLYETSLGATHPLTASAYNNLGIVYVSLARYDDALTCFETSLEIVRAGFGPEHPEVAFALNNIGALHETAGRLDEAVEPLTEALRMRERILAPDDPAVAESLNNVGNLHFARDKTDLAVEHWQRAVEIRRKSLGDEHPLFARSLGNMAIGLAKLGRHQEALQAQGEVLAIYEKVYGPDHPEVGSPLLGIGLAHLELGHFREAIEPLERATRIRDQSEDDAGLVGETRFAYARALWETGERAKSHEVAEAAEEAFALAGDRSAAQAEDLRSWLSSHRP